MRICYIYAIVTWSPTERREIKNYDYPSVFELAGRQRLTAKKRNNNCRSTSTGLLEKVKNVGQSESQQMFAFCDQGKEEKRLNDWLES